MSNVKNENKDSAKETKSGEGEASKATSTNNSVEDMVNALRARAKEGLTKEERSSRRDEHDSKVEVEESDGKEEQEHKGDVAAQVGDAKVAAEDATTQLDQLKKRLRSIDADWQLKMEACKVTLQKEGDRARKAESDLEDSFNRTLTGYGEVIKDLITRLEAAEALIDQQAERVELLEADEEEEGEEEGLSEPYESDEVSRVNVPVLPPRARKRERKQAPKRRSNSKRAKRKQGRKMGGEAAEARAKIRSEWRVHVPNMPNKAEDVAVGLWRSFTTGGRLEPIEAFSIVQGGGATWGQAVALIEALKRHPALKFTESAYASPSSSSFSKRK